MHRKQQLRVLGVLALVGAWSGAQGVALVPGGSVLLGTGISSASLTDTIIHSASTAFVGKDVGLNTRFMGTLHFMMGKEAGGTLNFYYQIVNSAASADSIERMTTTDFSLFATDVYYITDLAAGAGPGVVAPHVASRSAGDGRVVRFHYDDVVSGGAGYIAPGSASNWMLIKTDATTFAVSATQIINGGIATVETLGPVAAPVPEPVTVALAAGALGIALRRRNDRSRKAPRSR